MHAGKAELDTAGCIYMFIHLYVYVKARVKEQEAMKWGGVGMNLGGLKTGLNDIF